MSQAASGARDHQWEEMVSYGNSIEMRRAQMSSLSTLRGASSLWGANSTECLLCFEWEMSPHELPPPLVHHGCCCFRKLLNLADVESTLVEQSCRHRICGLLASPTSGLCLLVGLDMSEPYTFLPPWSRPPHGFLLGLNGLHTLIP